MDENSVSFQMFFKILLSFITLGSENQISVFKECQSNTLRCLVIWGGVGGGDGSMRRRQNLEKFFSKRKNFIRRFAWFNFSRLSLAFILKYYPILHAVKR